MNSIVTDKLAQLITLCKKYHVERMSLFGSASTDKFNEASSDIDLLFPFPPGLTPEEYGENYFNLMYELDDLFDRKVDPVSEKSLKIRISSPMWSELKS